MFGENMAYFSSHLNQQNVFQNLLEKQSWLLRDGMNIKLKKIKLCYCKTLLQVRLILSGVLVDLWDTANQAYKSSFYYCQGAVVEIF